MTTPVIEAMGLVKTFRGRGEDTIRAVDGIDLTVRSGEVVAFLGPNGAGKTTTLDILLGLAEPTSGAARVFDCAPKDAVRSGRVSAVLQTGGLLRDLSVGETVRVIASMFPRHQDEDAVLEQAGIAHLARRRISKCSGGEAQRVRFALALLPDPELIVLDEPTAGMDVTARDEFWAAMRAQADRGRTVLFATHYLAEAESFAERIVLLRSGNVVADGGVEQVRSASGARQISATVTDPEAALARLAELGANDVRAEGRRVSLRTTESDRFALLLLSELGARDLEVRLPSLDAAFHELTTQDD